MLKTLPNLLTLFRIILIPIFVFVYYLPLQYSHFFAAGIFFLAGATDWWDGYLARRLKQTSRFGAFLDPVADKLMVVISLIMIVAEPQFHFTVLPAMVIIGREIVISALREWMAEIGQRTQVAVAVIAKWKTLAQMLAIFLLIMYKPNGFYAIAIVGYIALYLSAVLTLWTMLVYLYAARKSFL